MNAPETASAAPPARRLPVRWSLVVATLLVLAAIVGLRRAEPGYTDKLAPVLLPGRVEQRVEARNFAVQVKRVKLAHAYRVRGDALNPGPRLVGTSGIWLSALTEVEVLQAPGFVSAQLRTRDGLVYPASDHDRPKLPGMNLSGQQLAAGLPATGGYFFELPPEKLAGAHLQFYAGTLKPSNMDHLVDIDLGLDAARTRKLFAEAKPVLDLQ
ncbi:hypothetical protein [Luteimonas aquatica]|uniref:hypothetical protein n=1 Tax=Luteimonas aquatica TaxID=450364 RepID=UPI001F5A05CD|nr:hypothetical protein [Luteimonas aquatica]